MAYVLLFFIIIGGQPQPLAGGPYKSMKECEVDLASAVAAAKSEKQVQAYAGACSTVAIKGSVDL